MEIETMEIPGEHDQCERCGEAVAEAQRQEAEVERLSQTLTNITKKVSTYEGARYLACKALAEHRACTPAEPGRE